MNKINEIMQFLRDNPYLSLVASLMLVLLIIVAFSKKDLNQPAEEFNKEIYYLTEDFRVSYMPNGDIIVTTFNPDYTNIDIIKNTLNLPQDANVKLHIPGVLTGPSTDDNKKITEELLKELAGDDLSSIGD